MSRQLSVPQTEDPDSSTVKTFVRRIPITIQTALPLMIERERKEPGPKFSKNYFIIEAYNESIKRTSVGRLRM